MSALENYRIKMVIVYHGNVDSVNKELLKNQNSLNAKYREILGEERAKKVSDVAQRVLTPFSFFDDVREINRVLGENLSPDATNKMFLATPEVHVDSHGNILDKKIKTSVGFYISERGFEQSGSQQFTERPIASYVHEFDHFIWYALQKVPLYLVRSMAQAGINAENRDLNSFVEHLGTLELPLEEKDRRLKLGLLSSVMTELYEHSNRVLDRGVLESIGIDVPLPWRGKERTYMYVPNPFKREIIAIPAGGDMFLNMEDEEVIKKVLDWENTYTNLMRDDYVQNLIDSLRKIKVSRLSLEQILELQQRKGKKRK